MHALRAHGRAFRAPVLKALYLLEEILVFRILILFSLFLSRPLLGAEKCSDRICFEAEHQAQADYLSEYYKIFEGGANELIKSLIKEHESEQVPFQSIKVTLVMTNVLKVSMQKPHYYGFEALIHKQHKGWSVLHKQKLIY